MTLHELFTLLNLLITVVSLSLVPTSSLSLSYALQLSVCDCVVNREAHSLFILILDLTLTHQGRLL